MEVEAREEPREVPALNPSLVLTMLQHATEGLDQERLKINQGAVKATAELIRLFVLSARAQRRRPAPTATTRSARSTSRPRSRSSSRTFPDPRL